MEIVRLVASILNFALLLYLLVLFARMILDLVPLFNREWRPRGIGLVAAEGVYTVTDPPLKMFRRVIPPVRLGPVALDLGFTITVIAVMIAMSITRAIALG